MQFEECFCHTVERNLDCISLAVVIDYLAKLLIDHPDYREIKEDLRQRILVFIDYFNRVLAKPFKWTYTGRPLKA